MLLRCWVHYSWIDRALDGPSRYCRNACTIGDVDGHRSARTRIDRNRGGAMRNSYTALYWRPQKTSSTALAAIAVVAIVGFVFVEATGASNDERNSKRLAAATLAGQCMEAIKQQRLKHTKQQFPLLTVWQIKGSCTKIKLLDTRAV